MSTTELDRVQAVAAPSWVSQATAVEQSRAIAEVLAAVQVAQQAPRSLAVATAGMREACGQPGLAERAFYRFPRSGQTVTGPSIHLARELARCWGNFQYGVAELRRDDDAGISEMVAYAWDVETNTRSETKFIVPHKRDKKTGTETLTDLRDIYENNANNAARRVREAIFALLPSWYVEEAKDLCSATLKTGGGKALPARIADAVKGFEALGVSVERLEAKVTRKTGKWNEHDVAQLGVIYKSIQRGEVRVDDEFPSRVTTADLVGADDHADEDLSAGVEVDDRDHE